MSTFSHKILEFAFYHCLPLWYENILIKIGLRLLWCNTKSKSKRHSHILKLVMTLCTWISCLIWIAILNIAHLQRTMHPINIWICINVQCWMFSNLNSLPRGIRERERERVRCSWPSMQWIYIHQFEGYLIFIVSSQKPTLYHLGHWNFP